ELSLHDDASLDGSLPASNKGDAPAKPPQTHFQTLNCPVLPPTTQEEQGSSSDVFMAWMMPKRSRQPSRHGLVRSLPPAWDSLAMTMRTKKNIDTLSIDDLYNNLSVFEQDIQKTSSSSLTSDNVAFLSQAKAKASSSKNKPS
ncbi:hypothetical protein Tco_0171127, partial [Tanacetum coccineum]